MEEDTEERMRQQVAQVRRLVIACEVMACVALLYICASQPGTQVTPALVSPICGWLAWMIWRRHWPFGTL